MGQKIRIFYQVVGIAFLLTFFFSFSALAQEREKVSELLLDQLNQIMADNQQATSHYQLAVEILQSNRQEVLMENKAISEEFERIKSILSDKEYYELIKVFFLSHFSLERVPNEDLIRFTKDFIEANKTKYSYECKKTLIEVIREGRLPYRNLGLINEGITYYTALANFFEKGGDPEVLSVVYSVLPGFYTRMGLADKAEYYVLKSLSYLDDNSANDTLNVLLGTSGKANRYSQLGIITSENNDNSQALDYLKLSLIEYEKLKAPMLYTDGLLLYVLIGRASVALEKDSSLYYFDKAAEILGQYENKDNDEFKLLSKIELNEYYAWYYLERGKYFIDIQNDSAAYYFEKAKRLKEEKNLQTTGPIGELIPNYYAAKVAYTQNEPLAAVELLLPEIQELRSISNRKSLLIELELLAQAFAAAGKYKEGFDVQSEVLQLMKLIKQESDATKTLSFEIEKQIQENENDIAVLKAKEEINEKVKYYLYGITALLGLFAITLGIAIFNKQKSNARLASKNKEVTDALELLKQTQSQLIQSEKMASLGELTAGIAHEIQNPLNFVNNFSEVNKELIEEANEELEKGDIEETKAILKDLAENSEKINHHGKRAGDIVKGMLEHSRKSTGEKVLTDLNALADEYLRLSYHGLRAKDKSFNADVSTDFDPNLPKVEVIPQDIGRVLLNLINNGFYAVNEKAKKDPDSYREDDYNPQVIVSTKKTEDGIEVSVQDNGSGIPDSIKEKIFQPFFTTKPTGSGTGLGLSLSYDIVKAHGGELALETSTNEGAKFIIKLSL